MPGRDTTPAAQTRAPGVAHLPPSAIITGVIGGIAALVASAVTVQAPRTAVHEGTVYRAYLDPAKIPTICMGHTRNVRLGLVATQAQCDAWLRQDLTEHTAAAIATTPALALMPSALEQAGDFHFNAGPAWWARSPMAAHFSRHEWRAGCESFRGYIVRYRAPKVVPGRDCRRDAKGVLYCVAPGLATRRERERALCLAGLPA